MRNNYMVDEKVTSELNMNQIRRLASFLKPYKKEVCLTVLFMIIATVTELIGPYLLQNAVDNYIPNKNIKFLVICAVAYLVSAFACYIFSRLKIQLASRTGQNVLYDMRTQVFSHVQNLSLSYFDNTSAGKIIVRIVNDINRLDGLFTDGIINVITEVSVLVMSAAFMIAIHPKLALITLTTVPVFSTLLFLTRNYIRDKWRVVRAKISNLNAYLHENITGMKVIQAFVRQKENSRIFHEILDDVFNSWMDAIKLNSAFGPSIQVVTVLGSILIYWFGVRFLRTNSVTVGVLIAFTSYLSHFWRPVNTLSGFYNDLLVAMASSERVFELLDTKPDIVDTPDSYELPMVEGNIVFKNVTFEYEKGRKVLKNINLEVKAGESIALVGETGSGKTTITNLLARFYDVEDGSILIDGHDIKKIKLSSLRSNIGIMMQDPFIFSGTVLENIKYGKPDATFDEVVAAAKAVNAHDFIMKMEQGYDTQLRERGSRLSIGERQLIAFARVLLADPAVLILDEATASIDTHTEMLVQEAIEELLKGRTSFVIAHRLSTIRNVDRILVIDNGEIVEEGTHEELLRRRNAYFNLYKVQYSALKAV